MCIFSVWRFLITNILQSKV